MPEEVDVTTTFFVDSYCANGRFPPNMYSSVPKACISASSSGFVSYAELFKLVTSGPTSGIELPVRGVKAVATRPSNVLMHSWTDYSFTPRPRAINPPVLSESVVVRVMRS